MDWQTTAMPFSPESKLNSQMLEMPWSNRGVIFRSSQASYSTCMETFGRD
ncbi:hypothetical protein GCM10027361_15600 [Erwinia aphidicola]